MKKIKTLCPAKINLYLKVLDKRKDGYHNIDTSFQLIDLADEMSFEICEKDIFIDSNQDFLCGRIIQFINLRRKLSKCLASKMV
jgi:4-diphosphocytidyl-2-C-methyl-D-erythritol kinase